MSFYYTLYVPCRVCAVCSCLYSISIFHLKIRRAIRPSLISTSVFQCFKSIPKHTSVNKTNNTIICTNSCLLLSHLRIHSFVPSRSLLSARLSLSLYIPEHIIHYAHTETLLLALTFVVRYLPRSVQFIQNTQEQECDSNWCSCVLSVY